MSKQSLPSKSGGKGSFLSSEEWAQSSSAGEKKKSVVSMHWEQDESAFLQLALLEMASAKQQRENFLGEHWQTSTVAHNDNLWRTKLMLSWVSLIWCPLCFPVLYHALLSGLLPAAHCTDSALKLWSCKGPANLSPSSSWKMITAYWRVRSITTADA